MSVVTRNRNGGYTMPGSPTGRPLGPIEEMEPERPQLQRQAVIDQLGTPPAGGPVASAPGTFARGGQVKQLPGSGVKGKIGDIAGGVGVQIAGKQLGQSAAQAAAGGVAQSGIKSALTSGAGGAAAGMGIGIGTGLLANKLRVKEDMPVFGGENGQYLDDFGRRFQGTGGGINSNAIKYAGMAANPALTASTMGLNIAAGATFGAIKGAVTKHAKSAYTDFSVEDGAEAIKAAYKNELGRDASDEEVQNMLVGQGWDPKGGDRWVGEGGINYVLDHIRDSPEAQAFRTRGSVVDQLGSGGAEPTVQTGVPAGATREGGAAGAAGKQPLANDPTVQQLTPEQAAALNAWHDGSDGRRAAFSAESDRLGAEGWDGRAETRGSDVMGDQQAEQRRVFEAAGIQMSGEAAAGGGAPNIGQEAATTSAAVGGAGRGKLEGFDGMLEDGRSKLEASDSPKYQVARVLQKYPSTPAGLQQALAEINALGLGTAEITGSKGDKLRFGGQTDPRFNGVTEFDVIRSAGNGGEAWQWDGGGAQPAPNSAGAPNSIDVSGGAQPGVAELDGDTLAKLKAELERIMSGQPDRQALMAQMGGANG